jgi:hypothetical protein
MGRNLPEPQKRKLLSRTDKQSGKAALLHVPQRQAPLLLLQLQLLLLPHLPSRLLSEEVVRLNPYRRTKPNVPVDQTLFPDTENRGESRVITLSGPMIGRSSTLAVSSGSFAPLAKEPFDFLYASYTSGGGTHPNMS